ncbi:Ig-like domain-containing protein [bacterium]|nr:Ig-like domain-containing protein [bacterium]
MFKIRMDKPGYGQRILPFALALAMGFNCAKEGFPPGGPEDRSPPEVLATVPGNGALKVDLHTQVEILFSERVQPGSAESAVFISPYPGGDVRYQWRGSRLKIRFPEPLRKDRTYVVNIGTGLKDYRQNLMKKGFTLAFSTGTVLDRGRMSGQVFGQGQMQGVDVWAYGIPDSPDPDPSGLAPEYRVQCDAQGRFEFLHMAPGLYRVFAVRDRISDRIYRPMEDEIGITWRDILVPASDSAGVSGVLFRLGLEDTLAFSLAGISPVHRSMISVQFNDAVEPWTPADRNPLALFRREDGAALGVRAVLLDARNANRILVLTEEQIPGAEYGMRWDSLYGRSGNAPDSASQNAWFTAVADRDSTGPALLEAVPRQKDRDVAPHAEIQMLFSEPMDTSLFAKGFSLSDTSGNTVSGSFQWEYLARASFMPVPDLLGKTQYRVRLDSAFVRDVSGNAGPDSVYGFTTVNPDTFSEVSGVISDSAAYAGRIHIRARKTGGQEVLEYDAVIAGPGPYRIEKMLPGRYVLECFRDQDGNGRFSPGRPHPFEPSERFAVYQDTLAIRSRWPNEGNDIRLP